MDPVDASSQILLKAKHHQPRNACPRRRFPNPTYGSKVFVK